MAVRSSDISPATREGGGGAEHHLLVVANQVVGDEDLLKEIRKHAHGSTTQVRIVAPALVDSPLDLAPDEVVIVAHPRQRAAWTEQELPERAEELTIPITYIEVGQEPGEDEDERVDREAEETFPASDPPANY